jgi:CRP-like cAMP-binding protein
VIRAGPGQLQIDKKTPVVYNGKAMDNMKKFISKYNAGDILYKKGEMQTDFFIINKGRVQLKIGQEEFVLTTLGKGDFFGEESLNTEQNAVYTIEALEESDIIKIPFLNLVDMMKQSRDISLKILRKLSEKHIKIQAALLNMVESATASPQTSAAQSPSRAHHAQPRTHEKTSEKITPETKAYLIIQRSNRIVQLTKAQTFLGRRDYTTGFVPDVDLTDEDEEKYISRKHAQIMFSQGKFYMSEEAGAINGTFLNGNKLNTGEKYELHADDELTLCHLNIIFKI